MHPDDRRLRDEVEAVLNRQGWAMLIGWVASVALTIGAVLVTGIGAFPAFALGTGLGILLPAVGAVLARR